MALIPKNAYPGQTTTVDPGYPHGKARNVSVPGDGTGTPWEEQLVNDLFGMQQALLAAVGFTPSGTPDKVGASQYLDAIVKVRDLLRDDPNVWSDANSFLMDVVLGGLANELLYTAPRLRHNVINPFEGFSNSSVAIDRVWSRGPAETDSQLVAIHPDAVVRFPIRLPQGATLLRVRASVISFTGGTTLTVHRSTYDTTNGSGTEAQLGATATAPVGGPTIITSSGGDLNEVIDSTSESIWAKVRASPTAAGGGMSFDALQWLDVYWLDPGPRNH